MNVNSIWDLGIRIWDFRFSLDPGKFHSCSNAETAEDERGKHPYFLRLLRGLCVKIGT